MAGQAAGPTAEAGGDSLARSVVDHALRYRAQRPLVDALLKEIGLGDIADLSGLAEGAPSPKDNRKDTLK